nr:Chromosome partition protein like [Ipomoea batatas]
MLLLHLHPCISLQKHPIFSPPSLFFNSHNKASVSAFGVGRWEALKKSRRRGQGPPLRAAEKDSDYEVDPDKAREALRKLDEQLQSLAQKKPDPPPPKIRVVKQMGKRRGVRASRRQSEEKGGGQVGECSKGPFESERKQRAFAQLDGSRRSVKPQENPNFCVKEE